MSNPQPYLIRLRDAPDYIGMDKNRFNKEVRPYLNEIPIGKQGLAFKRVEIEEWVEQYIKRNGRPTSNTGEETWDAKKSPDYVVEMAYGTSKKTCSANAFAKALERATRKKLS